MRNIIIIGFVFLISVSEVLSQPGDPGGGGNPGDVPIGGIEILLLIGGALGINRFLKSSKKNK